MSMAEKSRRKKCHYCKEWFQPDPRVVNQQKACRKRCCRKKRKQQANQLWVKKNPEYFKGQYTKTQQWLDEHPGYLKAYRTAHPETVRKNREGQKRRRERAKMGDDQVNSKGVDIQDTITTQPFVGIEDRLSLTGVDIQDAMMGQVIVPVYVRDYLGDVDIQDNICRRAPGGYTPIRVMTTSALKRIMPAGRP